MSHQVKEVFTQDGPKFVFFKKKYRHDLFFGPLRTVNNPSEYYVVCVTSVTSDRSQIGPVQYTFNQLCVIDSKTKINTML